ncbi:aldo/keto reductase [Sporosarcina sp. Sa2YVA2]|uniref:Aldo/keto reductase n=1 Tax=Sporosarcina quadrami TaxID=2762234 RepID=A0ABR8UA48_9BACL|nr:aldo/keto reductase [Sporosarcina quadrami]MBD7984886.1 aldo/keto reductase [Sporosarcina quadrami]
MKERTLNNGIAIPIVGSGTNTYGKEGNQYRGALRGDTQEIDWAIENGYRHLDCAQAYNNEEVVGEGIRKSFVPREEFFITTKLNTFEGCGGADWARAEIDKSLEKLQTDYVDLFLLHAPWDQDAEMLEAWRILEDYYNRGVFKSIGVSNFKKEHLDLLLEKSNVPPAVNQIKSQVGHWNEDLIAYDKMHGIATVAWSPLGGIDEKARKVLDEIGQPYGKTYAQVVLRYQIERDVIVIPKSHNQERQAQSLDIFDFELTASDRDRIAELG